MNKWFMLTVIGVDRPGIVARITAALFAGGANLGEASMMRLGGNFTVMLMVQYPGTAAALYDLLREAADRLELQIHIDEIEGRLHEHLVPDVRVTVHGADRAGLVAQVTGALAEAGLNILDLQSDVAGTADKPLYVMNIEGTAEQGIEKLRAALAQITPADVEVHLTSIDVMIG